MTDYISREAAYESLLNGMVMTGFQSRALDCISEFFIPAADVRPIVYCRDCKHFTERRACSLLVVGMKEDDFCSYGAKMEVSDA